MGLFRKDNNHAPNERVPVNDAILPSLKTISNGELKVKLPSKIFPQTQSNPMGKFGLNAKPRPDSPLNLAHKSMWAPPNRVKIFIGI